jgi:hypothetical protein
MRPQFRLARGAPAAILLVLAAATTSAQTPRVTFGAATSTDLGINNPAGQVVGDFNQDGHLDLIVTSKGAPNSNVKLLTGDGAGSLSPALAFSFADASAIAAADFNGDGVLDVAMTQDILAKGGGYGDSVCGSLVGIAIFLGPNMSSARCLATFPRAAAIQAGDFDGNGRPDIVVVSGIGQGLLIYSGFFFVPPYTVIVTSVPGSGVLATGMAPSVDLDGDGNLDLVVSHSTGVSTYLGNGDVTFRVGGSAGGSNKTQAAAVGDLNGDGVPDVASVENMTDGRLLVAFGAGDGSFSTVAPVSTIGSDLSDVATADIDHDGHADVVVAHKGAGTIRIFFGNGDGTFVADGPLAISVQPKFLAVRDWDEDGDLDLGIIDTSVGGLNALAWVARQEGSGPLDVTPPTVALTSPSAGSIVSGTVAVTATAADDVGVTRVDFYAGITLIATSAGPDYMGSWNTTAVRNGLVTLTARAFDGALNPSDSVTVEVTVDNVPVPDTTPPVVTVPADATVEATGPTGAVFSYTASATDNIDGALPVSCAPPSGSTFPLGTTTVTCTATDTHGNTGSASFTVTVNDTTPPVLTVPANATVEAASPAGVVFTYTASATDTVDTALGASCAPPSGSTFLLGTTTVTCTATDAHGNVGSGSFTVTAYRQVLRRQMATGPVRDRRAGRPIVMRHRRASDGARKTPSIRTSYAPAADLSAHHLRSK